MDDTRLLHVEISFQLDRNYSRIFLHKDSKHIEKFL